MELSQKSNYSHNTFIFNWVKNYNDQVHNLTKTLEEKLQNKVKVYNHLAENELIEVVSSLTNFNFELYNYIVIIILDNNCEYEQFIKTSDNQNVLLHSEILTKIQTNSTLENKPRLFVIQKLLDVRDIDDSDEIDKIIKNIDERTSVAQSQLNSKIYQGVPTIQIRANELNKDFPKSRFLEIFSKNIGEKAKTKAMDIIFEDILEEVNDIIGYKIYMDIESNLANKENNFLFGEGISSDVLRDFFELFIE